MINPCLYKNACKICSKVDIVDRPGLCQQLECEYYTPCSRCGLNVNKVDFSLGHCGDNKCEYMKIVREDRDKGSDSDKDSDDNIGIDDDTISELLDIDGDYVDNDNIFDSREFGISLPGDPPEGLTQDEKVYFAQRWTEYEGYYRDPVAYVICHHMILEEINLSYVSSMILKTRGERASEFESRKSTIYTNLKKLKEQLPEKDSQKLSDDEKSLSFIYEKYCKENDLNRQGKHVRVLTQDAIALAPELIIKIDPYDLLINCGYSIDDAKSAADSVVKSSDVKMSGVDLLTFLGYKLKEEFAMPTDSNMKLEDFMDE